MVAPNTLKEMAQYEGSNNSSPQRSTSGGDDSDSDMDDENSRPRGGGQIFLASVPAESDCFRVVMFLWWEFLRVIFSGMGIDHGSADFCWKKKMSTPKNKTVCTN